jgi:hypothetical protein
MGLSFVERRTSNETRDPGTEGAGTAGGLEFFKSDASKVHIFS